MYQKEMYNVSRWIIWFILSTCLLVIAGNLLDISLFKNFSIGNSTMKVGTAYTTALFTTGVLLDGKSRKRLMVIIMVIILGMLTMHLWGWDDPILGGTSHPWRMSLATCVFFMGLCIAILIEDRWRNGYHILTLMVLLLSSTAAMGYFYEVEVLYRFGDISISMHNTINFVMITMSFLLMKPKEGFMAYMNENNASGYLLRRWIPVSILMPIVIWKVVTIGSERGFYDAHFNESLYALINVVGSIGILATILYNLRQIDNERKTVMSDLEQAQEQLELRVRRRTSELQAANWELEGARKKAEESNQLKTHFLTIMSHELRTPLNAIIGFSDVLGKGMLGDLTEDQKEYVGDILNNGKHLLSIINDILDLSKIEAGQFEIQHENVNIEKMVRHVQKRLQSLADEKHLKWITNMDPQLPPTIYGDELRLKQILINLIGNAIKFTDQGSIEVHIECVDDRHWHMSVKDTGIGIAEDQIPHLFEEFHQVESVLERKYEGTGLGLSIVDKLTTLMGGSIQVHSELDRGSTFTVILPLEVGNPED